MRILFISHLAIISHSKPRILRIRKRHPPSRRLTRNLNPIRHGRTARRGIHHKLGRRNWAALQRHSTEQRLSRSGSSKDVNCTSTRGSNRVVRGEVDFELAAVAAGGDVAEGEGVGDAVEAAGVLMDVVVYGESNGLRVGDLAGAAAKKGGCGWSGAGEESRAQESGGEGELHFELEGLELVDEFG